MAVCGRCLLCGYKFNGKKDDGTEPDAAVRWPCESEFCKPSRISALRNWGEIFEHAICTRCHDVLAGKIIDDVIADLVALVALRSTDYQSTPQPIDTHRKFAQDVVTLFQKFLTPELEERARALGLDVTCSR